MAGATRSNLSRRCCLGQIGGAAAAAMVLAKTTLARSDGRLATLRPGVLRVGTYFVNPPFEFLSGGKEVGFEVDLMRELAHRLALRCEFANTRWEVILPQMQENRYDCIVGGITITPGRARLLAWSNPYLTTTLSLVVDSAKSPGITTLADLKDATVGVQAATTDYDAAVAMQQAGKIRSIKVYPFAKIADAVTDLTAGRIEAVMKVYPVAAWFVRQTPGLRILAQVPNDPQPLAIGFNQANQGLVGAVDSALASMQQDGTFNALLQRWGFKESASGT